jgi:hypothetical protein
VSCPELSSAYFRYSVLDAPYSERYRYEHHANPSFAQLFSDSKRCWVSVEVVPQHRTSRTLYDPTISWVTGLMMYSYEVASLQRISSPTVVDNPKRSRTLIESYMMTFVSTSMRLQQYRDLQFSQRSGSFLTSHHII